MKILYGVQGTGHGHISRAREIVPSLQELADVDILVSGKHLKMTLDGIPVWNRTGITMSYDSHGRVSYLRTLAGLRPVQFVRDVLDLDLSVYDVVISDYEPVSAWAAKKQGVHCIGMSHQASFLSAKSPRPAKVSLMAEQILHHFAPVSEPVGFHFLRYDEFIEPPVIRREVQELSPVLEQRVTVYLPSYHHEFLARFFRQIPEIEWHIFSPYFDGFDAPAGHGGDGSGGSDSRDVHNGRDDRGGSGDSRGRGGRGAGEQNVVFHPIGNRPFLESMERSLGVLTGGGFESCAETMYLGKKLMSIPIQRQYEQLCNAAALEQLGISVVYEIGDSFPKQLRKWLFEKDVVTLPEIADTQTILQRLLKHPVRNAS
jgi:uncharacterized protein (TIGR00661 family)